MAKLYAKKIAHMSINNDTGKPWCLDDVPQRWRAEVELLLAK